MIKKLFLLFCSLICFSTAVFADEAANVRQFFDSYVNAANTYSKTVPNFYLPNAKIIRTVIKPDGTKASLNVPMNEYIKQLKLGQAGARLVRYKNDYRNVNVTKLGQDYRVSAVRYPKGDKEGLSCYFVVTKTPSGYKFKVEQMDTKVQTFLKYIK